LDTAARSYDEASEHTEDALEEDEDGELDSLDSHLHEFRTDPSVYRGERAAETSGTVLPTHDGLGSFRIDDTAMGDDVQQRLYAFERFNPRRVKRRRESVELGAGLLEGDIDRDRAAEMEKTRRVEEWRMEQSRVLFEEIQRETRRRKQSMSSERRSMVFEREQEDVATLSNVAESVDMDVEDANEENESFWNRITKRVIRDLMGIDDDLLSIIFGESLPQDGEICTTPPANSAVDAVNTIIATNQYEQSSWEYRLLERIARELGILVNQLTDHPAAFSTYLESQQTPLPYAGLPVIPESARDHVPNPSSIVDPSTFSPSAVEFQPTIQATQPIPISSTSLAPPALEDEDATPRALNPLSQPLSREEWERDLDIKMVFRYLRSRFTHTPHTPSSPVTFSTQGTSHLATASTVDTAARAARVRQHHPLVNRERQQRVRTYRVSVPGKEQLHIRRGSSGCGSERGLGKRTSGSSRHYWDHATSVGSGSLLASTGGMGSWGEV
jgi:hypothetical protein